MANNLLDAISILHSWTSAEANRFDNELYDADDGGSNSAKEAKEKMIHSLGRMITELEEMRVDCKNLSWKKFKERHL